MFAVCKMSWQFVLVPKQQRGSDAEPRFPSTRAASREEKPDLASKGCICSNATLECHVCRLVPLLSGLPTCLRTPVPKPPIQSSTKRLCLESLSSEEYQFVGNTFSFLLVFTLNTTGDAHGWRARLTSPKSKEGP
jgi:hypothetical protein